MAKLPRTYNIKFVRYTSEEGNTLTLLVSGFLIEDLPHDEENKEFTNQTQEVQKNEDNTSTKDPKTYPKIPTNR